jgi:O-antigen/teichoic acid export membrane protein
MTDDGVEKDVGMTEKIGRAAGSAFLWKGLELAFNKGVSTIRLLVLARLLLPDDFGLMATGLAVTQTLLLLTDLGMIPALVQRRDVGDDHYHIAWTTEFFRGLLITVLVLLAAPLIAELFAEPRAAPIIRALAIYPFIEAVASIKVAELTRRLQFRSLALLRSAAILTETTVSILLAGSLGVWALVLGVLTGAVIFTTTSYIIAPYRPRLLWRWSSARPLINYGRWVLLTGLIVVAGSSLLPIVISRQIGVEGLGLYYLAVKLAFLPNEIINGVIGSVAFPVYARLQADRERLAHAFRVILTGLAVLFAPVYVLIIVLVPTLVNELLGSRWDGTVDVIRVLSVVGLVGLLGETVVPMLKGVGQPYKVMILELIQSALLIILIYNLAVQYDLVGAALAWLPAIGVSFCFSVVFVTKLVPQPFNGLLKPLLAITFTAVVGGAAALLIDQEITGVISLFFATGGALGITALLLWMLNRVFRLGLTEALFEVLPQLHSLRHAIPLLHRKQLVP